MSARDLRKAENRIFLPFIVIMKRTNIAMRSAHLRSSERRLNPSEKTLRVGNVVTNSRQRIFQRSVRINSAEKLQFVCSKRATICARAKIRVNKYFTCFLLLTAIRYISIKQPIPAEKTNVRNSTAIIHGSTDGYLRVRLEISGVDALDQLLGHLDDFLSARWNRQQIMNQSAPSYRHIYVTSTCTFPFVNLSTPRA